MAGKNKPVIALTGATGFLGSHLMATMLKKGYSIIVLGRTAKNESLKERSPDFYNGSELTDVWIRLHVLMLIYHSITWE